MKQLWTSIFVKDMDESVKFYTEILNLEISKQMNAGDYKITFLGKGETKFELIENPNLGEVSFTDYASTGFQVESLDECIKFLNDKTVEIVEGPIKPNPFVKFIFIKDPNGYKIQLVEHKHAKQ